jgi:hypothetical protein
MPEESRSEKIARIEANIDKDRNNPEKNRESRWKKIKSSWITPVAASVVVAGGILGGLLAYEYFSGRQDYTQRNILFRSSNTIYLAGSSGKEDSEKADKESIIKVYSGGGIESKVGTYLFETTRETRGDIDYYNMDNSQRIRIASATQKPERFQAGVIRPKGYMNFREEFAEIVLGPGSRAPQKYMVYKFAPKRAWRESDVDVVEYPIERGLGANEPGVIEKVESEKGPQERIRMMVNRLVESRTTLGWFFGKDPYRKGTLLEDFEKTPENKKLAERFLEKIRLLDSTETTNKKVRERLVKEVIEIEKDMPKRTIYSTRESGFLKMLPQGSITYLGESPGKFERFKNWLGFGRKDHTRLEVNNHWDLWPGNYPGLNYLSQAFNKYNNGGYTIKDKFGDVARVDIRDFWFFYGLDVVYSYYFDLNGEVLCTPSRDERMELKKFAKGIMPEADTTFTINYAFMSPVADEERGMELFKLCMYMETMMPDQLHRGYGKHSLIGLINDQRSDIMLYHGLSIENESRALTQESTLAAKYDIIKALIAAKRPYAKEIAEYYGIAKDFEGKFETSNLLKERFEVGSWPWLVVPPIAIGAGIYFLRERRKKSKDKREQELKNKLKDLNKH